MIYNYQLQKYFQLNIGGCLNNFENVSKIENCIPFEDLDVI